ncbi:MAG: T9SS type A sorting domain-containing protein [Ignavibacteria bacterium]|nr:T9SS type A sorting domain-containing protein [Ignavibacteria bacterium]
MKRQIFIATAVVLCSVAFGSVDGLAQQIFNQFRQPQLLVGRPYRDLDACAASLVAKRVISNASFVLPPTNAPDLDDGYAFVAFPGGFQFNFNGRIFTGMYVSVNGFITFDGAKLLPAKQAQGLFINSSSYPDNVIAPFWGDHKIRKSLDVINGYMPSEISYALDVDRNESCDTIKPVRPVLVIQWKNLNVNDASVNSSVANFQARLYASDANSNYQGNIELAYGQVGGNPNTNNTTVVTRGATVGIKGTGGFPGFLSDFWNGLIYSPQLGANSRTDSTFRWQPSGGRSDAVISFQSIVYLTFDIWGYGDADTSAARNQRHDGTAQNIRVTANDARVIIKSIVMKQPLDSVWKRQAYQGDVNHSGRYYFSKLKNDFSSDSLNGSGAIVIWRRTIDIDQWRRAIDVHGTTGKQVLRVLNESEGLYGINGRALDLSNLNQIYYEVTEYDAALIMRYLSGRLPYLPWVYDNDTTGPNFGKVAPIELADNINFGTPTSIGNGLVRVPVYLNGNHNRAFGFKFSTDANISQITPVNPTDGFVTAVANENVAVVTGSGSFATDQPVAYVTMPEKSLYEVSEIRFNEVEQPNAKIQGLDMEQGNGLSVYPNPTAGEVSVAVEIPNSALVTLKVYDTFGKSVATIFSGNATQGTLSVNWNGKDADGVSVTPGAYVIKSDGVGVSSSTILTIVR